ncbi:uncharacterized protein LOC124157599 isoform X2 [Ischnura elegans]|uniref:uncharacterized protein LOC124157599 isoform X2 n=1 Tax=Ischnura elegans TaxID=197161 RepID=UPI001ED87ECA|nr:uncharacterized protein LOC124157599 isoform X2 [Ischnura elegans]
MSDAKVQSHVCVLCNAKLESKEALQEHFRKHANREIDGKGRPRKAKVPGGIVANGPKKATVPVTPQNAPRVNAPTTVPSKDVPTTAPGGGPSPSSSSNKTSSPSSASATGATKSPGKPSSGIVCDVCGQEFETVTIAIQHKFKKHPDSAIKHFCPHCGQQFPLKINRDKHLQLHPSDPPSQLFPCQECGVVFYNAQAQSYHFKSTHKRIVAIFKPVETPPPSKKIRMNNAGEAQSVYYCHICGYEYIIKFNLQKHIERHHPEEERNAIPEGIIKCTTCDALFYSKKAYDNHNMYHRPDDLYVTSEEQRLQTVSRVDQDFDIRRVQPGPEKFIPINRPRPPRPSPSLSKVESKMSLRKSKAKKSSSQRGNAGKESKDVSSDETEESDTSSESELSPDSGPDSDSDSDLPLKKCVKQAPAPRSSREPVKKKGTKRLGKAMTKFQAMAARKKAKLELTRSSSTSSSSDGEVGAGIGRLRGRGESQCVEKKGSNASECNQEPSGGKSKVSTRDAVKLVKVKQEVVNGSKEDVINAKIVAVKNEMFDEEGDNTHSGEGKSRDVKTVTVKKEVFEEGEDGVQSGRVKVKEESDDKKMVKVKKEAFEEEGESVESKGKVGIDCEGKEAKGSTPDSQGFSEQMRVGTIKSEPMDEDD